MPVGRPRTEQWIVRKWEIRYKDGRNEVRREASSMKAYNLIVQEIARTPGAQLLGTREIYWEYRVWLPLWAEPWEGDFQVSTYERKTFKGPSKEDILRRVAEHRNGFLRDFGDQGESFLTKGDHAVATKHHQTRIEREKNEAAKRRIPTLGSLIERNIAAKEERKEIEAGSAETARSYYQKWIKRETTPSKDDSLYVKPFIIADLKIDKVSQGILQEFVDSLGRVENRFGRPNSAKTVQNIVAVVRSAWNSLHGDPELGKFSQNLRFDDQVLRGPKKQTVRPNGTYTDAEIESILGAARDEIDSALLALGLLGLRVPGEACGIHWSDFYDADGHTFLYVTKQIRHVGGKRVLKPLKTGDKGIKTLYVPPRLKELIFSAKPLAEKMGSPFVLSGKGGAGEAEGSLSPSSAQEKFARVQKLAGAGGTGKTFYALRHTVMTALAKGGDVQAAQLAGGWTSGITLQNHYNKVKAQEILPEAMGKLPWAHANKPVPSGPDRSPGDMN